MAQGDFTLSSTLEHQFHVTRLIDKELVASICTIHMELEIGDGKAALLRLRAIKWWLENVLDQSTAYSVGSDAPLELLAWVALAGNQ